MTMTSESQRYPFRFYGREPADWTASPHGFLYDLQLAAPAGDEARATVRALAERQFGRGPAELGDVWRWSDDGRFLLFTVRERFGDAPRMVFTHVAEFLARLHQELPLRDVVLANAIGARADRWDAWSLEQSPEPDAGPPRPDAPWAALLRRPEDNAQRWQVSAREHEWAVQRAPAPTPTPAPAPEGVARKPRARLALAPCDVPPPVASETPVPRGWQLVEAAFPNATLERVANATVPIGWRLEGARKVAIVWVDGNGRARGVELPTGQGDAHHLAVDPDGLHAVTHVGQGAYSLDLGTGTLKQRFSNHVNNGTIGAIAWVEGDLWAFRLVSPYGPLVSQIQLWDLSEEDAIYVGTHVMGGELMGAIRHGTVLAVGDARAVSLLGVCDWQLKLLGRVALRRRPAFFHEDELIVGHGDAAQRLTGLDEVYEAWAAPLRRRAEQDRVRRVRPRARGVRWSAVARDAMPPDPSKPRLDALKKQYGEDARMSVLPSGDALVAKGRGGQHPTQRADLLLCPAAGRAKPLRSPTVAHRTGVTVLSLDARRETAFFIAGNPFTLHRVDLVRDKTEWCNIPRSDQRGGLLYDVLALGRDDAVEVWDNSLDWYRAGKRGAAWTLHSTVKLGLPRDTQDDAASRRIALTQQSRARLLVLHPGAGGFATLAECTDAVKRISFRSGRLFAQMLDGQWFELLGADAPPPSAEELARAEGGAKRAKRAKPAKRTTSKKGARTAKRTVSAKSSTKGVKRATGVKRARR